MATKNIVKKPRGTRANKAEIELLDPSFAAGAQMGYDGTRKKEEMWAEVTGQLNALGGHKSAEQWQTTWRDIKSKSCQLASSIRRARALTGGRPVEEKPLSELEKIIVSTTGTVYWEGGTTPDTLPEDSGLQSQLVNGEVSVLDLEPNTLSIAKTLSLPPIGLRHDNKHLINRLCVNEEDVQRITIRVKMRRFEKFRYIAKLLELSLLRIKTQTSGQSLTQI